MVNRLSADELLEEMMKRDKLERLEESDEEKDLSELLAEYQNQEKMWHFEGDSGLKSFEKICTAIGYPGHQFRYGVLEWIEEQNIPEWKESVISHLNEKEINGDSETE